MADLERIQKAALARLEAGESTEHILQDYADFEEELRPVLENASGTRIAALLSKPKIKLKSKEEKKSQPVPFTLLILVFVFVAIVFFLLGRDNALDTISTEATAATEAPLIIEPVIEEDINPNLPAEASLVIWSDGSFDPVLIAITDTMREQYGIELELEAIDAISARDILITASLGGAGPDIFIGSHDWLDDLVDFGIVAPIDLGASADEFLPASISAFQYDAVQYGMPLACYNLALVRNTELVPEVPSTWQQVREIAERFKTENGPYAFAIQDSAAYFHYPVLTAFGGYAFGQNEDGSYNPFDLGFANEGGLASAEWLSEMYADDLMPVGLDDEEILRLFEEGQVAMFLTGPWNLERLAESGIQFNADVLPGTEGALAQGVSFLGVQGFMINASSDNIPLAERFISEILVTPDIQESLFEHGHYVPAFVAVDSSSYANLSGFIQSAQTAELMPIIPEMDYLWYEAGNAYGLISQGEDPNEVFMNAQETIETAVATTHQD